MSLAAFRSVTLVGSVLPADAVTKAADLALPGQKPHDYLLTPGVTINAAAARAWADLTGAWQKRETALQTAAGDGATRYTRERWLLPLLAELGYGRVPALPSGVDLPPGLGETSPAHYPISHHLAWPAGDPDPSATVAIHLLGNDIDLDKRTAGVTARAPHAMVQEFLNRTDTYLFALLTNGRVLRLLRDASSLAKQSYIEFDLALMFREQLFSDFRLLYVLLHATRLTPRTLDTPAPAAVATTPPPIPGNDGADADGEDAATGELPEAVLASTGPRATDCWIEQWRTLAIEDGSRAREQLEKSVAAAITALGTGFVRHPANEQLRTALHDSPDADQDLRRWVLRLVYQLIVLFVAEDRDLLHPPVTSDTDRAARGLYKDHFSSARLRHLAQTRTGTRHSDQWDQLQLVFTGLGTDGVHALCLPALTASLYGPDRTGLLSSSRLSNRYLLEAIRHLSLLTDPRTGLRTRVDYRNLDSEELGGVYEGILGYVPRYDPDKGTFTLTTAAGSDRKKSGSYYTPSDMIALTLDEALDPIIDTALRDPDPQTAILKLTVCDPACGSGHFLVAAGRRLARALATARTGDPEPSPTDLQAAIRDVVATCLFGVDLNDLAIDLAKVALWLEALTPGKPFAYLDHHLKVGNALLGTTPALLAKNIPDDAFAVLDGDDKDYTKKLKNRNKAERQHDERQAAGQFAFDICTLDLPTVELTQRAHDIDLLGSDTIEQVRARADAWRALETDPELQNQRLVADACCAAFVQPKPDGNPPHPGISHATITNLRRDPNLVFPQIRDLIEASARQFRFFHWHLEFPSVFTVPEASTGDASVQGWIGGFSAVVGNPPWENYRPLDKEFFGAVGRDDIVNARTSAIRSRMIVALEADAPTLSAAYRRMTHEFAGTVTFLAKSGRYPLMGSGNMTTHDLFTEHARAIISPDGSAGVIIPTSIMTGSQSAPFVADILQHTQLAAFYDFVNSKGIFPGVHSSYRCGVLHLTGSRRPAVQVRLAFHMTGPADLTPDRIIALTNDDLTRINPNTKNLPVFARPIDARITAAIHATHPILRELDTPNGNPWQIDTGNMLDMSKDAHLFSSADDLTAIGATFDGFAWTEGTRRWVPLHEGKHVWHYDHRYATGEDALADKVRNATVAEHGQATFELQARHYVLEAEVNRKLAHRTSAGWLIGWRDIASATNQRTLIPAVFPRTAAGNTLPLLQPDTAADCAVLLAAMSSTPCDYVIRQKASGSHVSKGQLNQAPVPRPDTFGQHTPWRTDSTLAEWVRPYVLELAYTSNSLIPWARDLDEPGPPYRWDPARRALLQAELDAAMFHIYGLDRPDTEHVLSTFRALRDAETREHGDYRTQRLVLAAYDRMADAIRRGGTGWAGLLGIPAGQGPRHASAVT
jgi:hypothetical protein